MSLRFFSKLNCKIYFGISTALFLHLNYKSGRQGLIDYRNGVNQLTPTIPHPFCEDDDYYSTHSDKDGIFFQMKDDIYANLFKSLFFGVYYPFIYGNKLITFLIVHNNHKN